MGTPKVEDEIRLSGLARKMLATPPKRREESKVGKRTAAAATSPAKRTVGKGRSRVGKSKA
jgi:hypothetical protein